MSWTNTSRLAKAEQESKPSAGEVEEVQGEVHPEENVESPGEGENPDVARVVVEKAQEGHHERADGCGSRLLVGFVMRFGFRCFARKFRPAHEVRQSNRTRDDHGAEGSGDEKAGCTSGPWGCVESESAATVKMNADDGNEDDGFLFVDEKVEKMTRWRGQFFISGEHSVGAVEKVGNFQNEYGQQAAFVGRQEGEQGGADDGDEEAEESNLIGRDARAMDERDDHRGERAHHIGVPHLVVFFARQAIDFSGTAHDNARMLAGRTGCGARSCVDCSTCFLFGESS